MISQSSKIHARGHMGTPHPQAPAPSHPQPSVGRVASVLVLDHVLLHPRPTQVPESSKMRDRRRRGGGGPKVKPRRMSRHACFRRTIHSLQVARAGTQRHKVRSESGRGHLRVALDSKRVEDHPGPRGLVALSQPAGAPRTGCSSQGARLGDGPCSSCPEPQQQHSTRGPCCLQVADPRTHTSLSLLFNW